MQLISYTKLVKWREKKKSKMDQNYELQYYIK